MKHLKTSVARGAFKFGAAGLTFALLSVSSEAVAETVKKDAAGVGEIVVTAQRREQLANKTPLSLTALDQNALEDRKIEGLTDLQFVSPGIRSGQQQGVNRVFIRGIGLTSFSSGADPSIAFYADGVYVGRPTAQLSSFFDVARMEVLRGPQGALYGRNATGGAINLITNEPGTEFGGYANFTAGNYDLAEAEGAVSLPFSEDGAWRARLAGHIISRGGYGKDIVSGSDVNDAKAQSFRGTLQYNPTDAVDIRLIAEYHNERDSNNTTMQFGPYPGYTLQGVTGTVNGFGQVFQGTFVPNSQDVATSLQAPTNSREGKALTLNGSFQLSDAMSLTSVTGYRTFDRYNSSAADGTSAGMGDIEYWEGSEQISQEFTLNYDLDNLSLVAGANYYHERIDNHSFLLFSQFNGVDVDGPGPIPPFPDQAIYEQIGTMDIDAYAAYLQGTYSVTPSFRATAAVRYSWEQRDTDGAFTGPAPGPITPVPVVDKKHWDAINPKFGIEYDVNDQTLAYASVTNGFKSGTYNIGQVNPVINPEKIWAYEVGVKSRLFDNRLELTAAAFHYDYKDLQVQKVIGIATLTTNAATAKNDGFEISLRARPVDNLTIDANATYLDAKFKDFLSINPLMPTGPSDPGFAIWQAANPNITPTFVGIEQDLSGNQLPGAPKYQFNAGVQYDLPLGNDAVLTGRVDGAYASRIHFSEFNEDALSQKAVTKFNAFLKYDSGKNWTFSIWGKNITDKFSAGNKLVTIQLWGYPIYGSVDAPATYGATLGVKF